MLTCGIRKENVKYLCIGAYTRTALCCRRGLGVALTPASSCCSFWPDVKLPPAWYPAHSSAPGWYEGSSVPVPVQLNCAPNQHPAPIGAAAGLCGVGQCPGRGQEGSGAGMERGAQRGAVCGHISCCHLPAPGWGEPVQGPTAGAAQHCWSRGPALETHTTYCCVSACSLLSKNAFGEACVCVCMALPAPPGSALPHRVLHEPLPAQIWVIPVDSLHLQPCSLLAGTGGPQLHAA